MGKNYEEHESGVKKFLLNEKPFEINFFRFQKNFFYTFMYFYVKNTNPSSILMSVVKKDDFLKKYDFSKKRLFSKKRKYF